MAEQVRVDITATDKASDKLDDVADKAAKVDKLDPKVEVDADTRGASSDLDDFIRRLDRLSDTDRDIVLGLKAKGLQADLDKLKADVAALDASDPTLDVKLENLSQVSGDLDKLKAQIKSVRDETDRIGGSEGPRLAGNQIADLTGPFGAASSAASDFGGVFDGLADISEKVAGSLGLNAARIAGAMSTLGLGVAAVAAIWQLYTDRSKKAEEQQKRLIEGQKKLNDAVAAGRLDETAQAWIDQYGEFYKVAQRAGISWQEFITAVQGGVIPDSVLEKLGRLRDDTGAYTGKSREAAEAIAAASDQWDRSNKVLGVSAEQIDTVKDAVVTLNPKLGEQADKTKKVEDATDRASRKIDDMKGNIEALSDVVSADQSLIDLKNQMDDVRDAGQAAIDKQREANEATAKGADNAVAKQAEAARAMRDYQTQVNNLKQEIINLGNTAGMTDVQVETELQKIDAGDLNGVKADVEAWYRTHPVRVYSKLTATGDRSGSGIVLPPEGLYSVPGTTITNNYLARSPSGRELAAASGRHRRINGR